MLKRFSAFTAAILLACTVSGTCSAAGTEEKNCDAAVVPENDGLSFCWNCIAEENGAGETASILVRFLYRWESMPVCRWTDRITVTWDGAKLEMEEGSFRKTDMYDGVILDQFGCPAARYKDQILEDGTEFTPSDGSVSWEADLPAVSAVVPTSVHGYGEFRLKPVNGTEIGDEALRLRGIYVHNMLSAFGVERTWETGVTLTP